MAGASSSASASAGSPRSSPRSACRSPSGAAGPTSTSPRCAAAGPPTVSSFHGRHVDFDDAVSLPRPLQRPGPPILIGGDGVGPLRRVARYGDGWYPWNLTAAELEDGLALLDEQLAAHPFVDGRTRTRDDVVIQVGVRFRRGLDELAALIDAYAGLGASRVVVTVPISSSAYEERLAEIAAALGVTA